MPRENPDEQLLALGYNEDWLRFGVLSPDMLSAQIAELGDGTDPHTEHYRYRTFRTYLCSRDALSDDELEHYLALATTDADPTMGTSAIIDLFDLVPLTDTQFAAVCDALQRTGDSTSKIVTRQKLLRKLRTQPLTDELFDEGLASDDGPVQQHLLAIAGSVQLQRLAEHGRNKKIRNEAARRLQTQER